MRTYFKPLHTLILAGALTTLAGYSVAQPAPGTGPGAGPAAHGHHMDQHDTARMQTRMAERLAEFKLKLKVTPAQESEWMTFTDAIKPAPRAPMATSHAELSKLPTPERLDRMRALHTEHMAAMTTQMDHRANAIKTFYAVLSADQKKVFDDQFSRHAGARGGHRAGPMGGPHERHPHSG